MVDYRPTLVLRRELEKVFTDFRTIRAFEDLFSISSINIDSDDNANTLSLIQKYLLANVGTVITSGETSDVTDSVLVRATTSDITITMHDGALTGKIIPISVIEGPYKCIVDGNGNTIAGDSTFDLYAGESLILQADENNDWWSL